MWLRRWASFQCVACLMDKSLRPDVPVRMSVLHSVVADCKMCLSRHCNGKVCGIHLDPWDCFNHEHRDRAATNPHHRECSRRPDTTAIYFLSARCTLHQHFAADSQPTVLRHLKALRNSLMAWRNANGGGQLLLWEDLSWDDNRLVIVTVLCGCVAGRTWAEGVRELGVERDMWTW
jgi:hypothetical protein